MTHVNRGMNPFSGLLFVVESGSAKMKDDNSKKSENLLRDFKAKTKKLVPMSFYSWDKSADLTKIGRIHFTIRFSRPIPIR